MKTLVAYALSFVGVNYKWGGDDPMDGFDCSGLVQEILASVGMDPAGDQTSQALYNHFAANGLLMVNAPKAGAIAFYGRGVDKITHVAFCIDDLRIVEAGGGGSKTVDAAAAARQNAYVRVRPYNRRKDLVALIMPDYTDQVIKGGL